jgi:phage baseplate assembly protein W
MPEKSDTGVGLLYPLRYNGSDYESGSGTPLLRGHIRHIAAVKAASEDGVFRGEYPWRMDFGWQVSRFLHSNLGDDVSDDLMRVHATDAIEKWEPRVRIVTDRTGVVDVDGGRAVTIAIRFARRVEQVGRAVDYEKTEVTVD